MSSRILTPDVVDIDAFRRNPGSALAHAERGAVAVFDNNAPAFYAVTPARMAELLALEKQLAAPRSDVALEAQFFDEGNDVAQPVPVPMGKFAMYPGWQPDPEFQRMAALWGIPLAQPVTSEELASFVAYWQAEGKVFHHIQWQQKLARSLQMNRATFTSSTRRDVNAIAQPDDHIPDGFRG